MIDASAFMMLETSPMSKKADISRAAEKSGSNKSNGFSDYMNQSADKSAAKEEIAGKSRQRTEAKVEKKTSESVEKPDNADIKGEANKLDMASDESSDENVIANEAQMENVLLVPEEKPEQSTAALVSLLLQRAIKSNIDDSVDKTPGQGQALSAIQKQTSMLENLIQKNLTTDLLNKDMLQAQGSGVEGEKLSPELMKLILNGDKGGNILSKLDSLSNKQEMQLIPIDEVMDLNQEGSDLIAKFIEKLDLDKNKGELLFHNRMTTDKALLSSEGIESTVTKVTNEAVDRNLFANAANSAERSGSTTSLPQMKMTTPVSNPEWGAEFGKRIQMLIKNNIQHAEIRMDPPELGRIQIRINMSQDQANISFTALHSNVREAIESNMSRLRDMLGETGIQLGEADVSSQFQQQTNQRSDEQDQFSFQRQKTNGFGEGDDVSELPPVVIQHSIDGVIDYFA